MKIIDEKGKFFGKLNLIDLLVVVLIISAVVFVGIKLGLGKSDAETANDEVEYVIEVLGVREMTYSAICESNAVYSTSDAGQYLGEITAIEKKNARELTLLDNGEYTYAEYEDKYDVRITIKASCTVKNKGVYIAGGTQLLIGEAVKFTNGYVETSGEVISITVK